MKKRIKKLHRSNEGFSLMELIVTMLISSIVTAAVAGFLSMGLNYYRRTNAETASIRIFFTGHSPQPYPQVFSSQSVPSERTRTHSQLR